MNLDFTIDAEALAKGLRPVEKMPNNSNRLVVCKGAVGQQGVLASLEEIARIATDVITAKFPYPQIFVFTKYIIICGGTKIYELVNFEMVEKFTVSQGHSWRAVDFIDFVYLSNGKVAVTRNATGYSLSDLPVARAICNMNGQIIVGGL